MKKFVIPLLGTIFVLLLVDSTESVTADHLEPGEGIWKDENHLNLVTTKDSKYQVHLYVEVRNAQGQLISISETSHVNHIPHKITDNTFDTMLGKKEIITIDNVKYEQIKYSATLDVEQLIKPANRPSHFIGNWFINLCKVFGTHEYTCITPWQANTAFVSLEEDDVVKNHWSVLRIIN
jgi:hypothetical protein|uniref:Uncharacterized protein n=2 Tax=environmental samples TaxID=651140 RepID=A0A075GA40_9ARCH|nr:hypothetical protein [uncultured marine thaumarchaeote KM3_06_A04]AIE98562.1 hypothetical protein [uncultured marine thaumarchaeote KM3_06_B06]